VCAEDTECGEGFAAPVGDGHFLSVDFVSGDGCGDFSVGDAGATLDECEVGFFDLACGELGGDGGLGGVGFRNEEAAACFLVEAVNDAGSLDAADHGEAAEVMDERVDDRAGRVSRARVNDEAGRFVEDDEVGILV
jgi:hypothetical protein